jgi:hypothetical protein
MDTTFLFANIIQTARSFRGKPDVRRVRRKLKNFGAARPAAMISPLIGRSYRSYRDRLNALGFRFRLGDEVAHLVAHFTFRCDGGRHATLFVWLKRSAMFDKDLNYIQMVSSNSHVQSS